MTDSSTTDVRLPDDKPPGWANAVMRWALRTPGVQRMVGQGVALLGFDGRRTGTRYSIPVSYDRRGDIVTVITKRQRKWWRNFESPIEVELRLAGLSYEGKAEIVTDPDANLEFMTEYLQRRPIDAKAYGLAKDERTRDLIQRIIPHIVIIRIRISPMDRT
jgi:hypothetical protein